MPVQIQLRRDVAADWTFNEPTLAEGEIGLELDTNRFKIGDGVTGWAALPYRGVDGAPGDTIYQTDINLGTVGRDALMVEWSHIGAITSQRVMMQASAIQPSGTDGDELEMDPIICAAGIPASDTIRAYLSTPRGVLRGTRRFYYTIGD